MPTHSNPNKNLPAIHQKQHQPQHHQNKSTLHYRFVGITQPEEDIGADVTLEVITYKTGTQLPQAVKRDGIESGHHERKGPFLQMQAFDQDHEKRHQPTHPTGAE